MSSQAVLSSSSPHSNRADATASIPFTGLQWVWYYVAGTLCNLECAHCLVGGGPSSRVLQPLATSELGHTLEQVAASQQGRPFNIGFTGGEVFLLKLPRFDHRLFDMVELALHHGDLLILTNGLLADTTSLRRLLAIERDSEHHIHYRVSLDGPTAEQNDRLRFGRGNRPTFERILRALQRFVDLDLAPSVAYTYEGSGAPAEVANRRVDIEARYRSLLATRGLGELELVGIPFFDLGSEAARRRREHLARIVSPGITNQCITTYAGGAVERFQCSYSRSFAKEPDGQSGWYKCPVLSARQFAPDAYLGSDWQSACRSVTLEHDACITCFYAATQGCGMSCAGPLP